MPTNTSPIEVLSNGAVVSYLTGDFQPTSPKRAEMVIVKTTDNRVVFGFPRKSTRESGQPHRLTEHGVKGQRWRHKKGRAQRALKTYNPVTAEKVHIASRNEDRVAKLLGEEQTSKPGGYQPPFDVLTKGKQGVEVKTIISPKGIRAIKITMHPESLERKMKEAKQLGLRGTHTVVIMQSTGDVYYKKGLGSFRLNSMEKLSKLEDLKRKIR